MQRFVNTADLEHDADWLDDWLDEHEIAHAAPRARSLREALRALVLANNGRDLDPHELETLNAAAARLRLELDQRGGLAIAGEEDALDRVVATALRAMLDGTWVRLKGCRNCRWAFYDYSPNRSATWCSMQLCGNRSKTRAYRRRRDTGAPGAAG